MSNTYSRFKNEVEKATSRHVRCLRSDGGKEYFLDDILVYSRTLQEHARHVRFVLQTLRDKQFYAKISKCEFFKKSITYLGHLITERGVEIDPSRIEKIKLWPTLRNIREVRSSFGRLLILM